MESVLQRRPTLGELLDPESFNQVCKTFVDLYRIGLKIFDAQGNKLIDIKIASGDFCAYMFSGQTGRPLCTEIVTQLKVHPLASREPQARDCFSGLRYLSQPILYEGDSLGRIVFGPFIPDELAGLGEKLQTMGAEFDLLRAQELLERICRAPEAVVRRVIEHFARVVDVLLFTSHRALITSQLHIEAITESSREVNEKNRKLTEALTRLQELSRLKSNFLATVSHELRTPLTSIIGYSEMLNEGIAGDLQPEQREFIGTIHEKGEQLLELIMSLLDLSKLESGTLTMKRKSVAIATVLHEVLTTVTPNARKKGVAVKLEVDPKLVELRADPERLRQVFINLVDNALKFTPKDGTITVRARNVEVSGGPGGDDDEGFALLAPAQTKLEVRVMDTGIGIPPKERTKVFDAFYQVDSSSTREYGGTGLGLSIVKRIVEAHGGSISIDENQPRGAVFIVSLPTSSGNGKSVPPLSAP